MKKKEMTLTRIYIYSVCAIFIFLKSSSIMHAQPPEREVLSSIGSLVQRSEIVARGIIGETLEPWNDDDIKSVPWNVYMDGVIVAFQPTQTMIGNRSVARDISRVAFIHRKDVPQQGEEVILFLSRKWIDPNLVYYSFDRVDEFEDYKQLDEWVVVGGRRGMLTGNEVILDDLENVIRQYDKHLRKPIDIKRYVYFLAEMREYPNDRVIMDAWGYDWYRTIISGEWQDARQEILEADDLPEAIIRWREMARERSAASLRTRSREEVEATFEEHEWWDAIRSGDKDRIRHAFRLLGNYASHELELYQDLWREDMMDLLESPDADIRVWAASRLVRISEKSAIPVLIQALRSERRVRRSASSIELRRYTGQNIPFDPDAPTDARERMVKAWEEWWERESTRETE